MSELAKLKQQIDAIAGSAKKTGSQLGQFDKSFSQQASQVQQTIGGSAQRKDAEVVAAVQHASKAVKQAVAALQNAASVAQRYGQSL